MGLEFPDQKRYVALELALPYPVLFLVHSTSDSTPTRVTNLNELQLDSTRNGRDSDSGEGLT